MDRGTGRHTDYEAWRRGALGERIVGKELERLGNRWRVLHSVPDGNRGGDIDHLLIGPGGVFCINTKNHSRVPVKVTAGSIYTSGHRTDYLVKARAQAERATARLGVTVFPMLCIIPHEEGKYSEQGTPADVAVVRSDRLQKWAKALIPRLSEAQVEAIYAKARRLSTWTTPTRKA
ncbi:NERD domain-containing protein (plasmid) [Citricoccus nitrophenolicus]